MQEIRHRYLSIRQWPKRQRAYAVARQIFPHGIPITGEAMDQAKSLADSNPNLSTHVAVVHVYKLEDICTFDRDFDHIPVCKRIDPDVLSPKAPS